MAEEAMRPLEYDRSYRREKHKRYKLATLDDFAVFLFDVTRNAVHATGSDFFHESDIARPQWWPAFAEYFERKMPEKVIEAIRMAKQDEERRESAWPRKLRRFGSAIAWIVVGIFIGWAFDVLRPVILR